MYDSHTQVNKLKVDKTESITHAVMNIYTISIGKKIVSVPHLIKHFQWTPVITNTK